METQHLKLALSKYIETLPEFDQSKIEKMKLYSEEAYDKFIPHTFIKRTNHIRAGKIEDYLANQFSLGVNRYPFILENTTNMMIIY